MAYNSKESLIQLTKLIEDFSNQKINADEANETLGLIAKTNYENNIFLCVYEYIQSEKVLSRSYKDNAQAMPYIDDTAIGDYIYKEVEVEISHMFSKQKIIMYRVYVVVGYTGATVELAPITKNIKLLPITKQELLDCTSPFEASDNNFVKKRDKDELHKLILGKQ
jgi:hypothetical protein